MKDLAVYFWQYFPGHVAKPVAMMVFWVALEASYYRVFLKRPYAWCEGKVTLPISFVEMSLALVFSYFSFYLFQYLEPYSRASIELGGWKQTFLVLFVSELIFYVAHVCSHRWAWFWADHSVHHTSKHINLFAGNRMGWTGIIAGMWIFAVPFVLIGLPWTDLNWGLGVVLVYQYFIHTEIIGDLGALEHILNTPKLHRVHHAMNHRYVNSNYGGITIIFDRIFGTLRREIPGEAPVYGTPATVHTNNLWEIVFIEWYRFWRRAGMSIQRNFLQRRDCKMRKSPGSV